LHRLIHPTVDNPAAPSQFRVARPDYPAPLT
jgi:hypothetical protein